MTKLALVTVPLLLTVLVWKPIISGIRDADSDVSISKSASFGLIPVVSGTMHTDDHVGSHDSIFAPEKLHI